MNRKILYALLVIGLLGIFMLAACNQKNDPNGTDTTAGGTTAKETEAVTAVPRYDYLEAEVAPDVEIEKSDYTDLKLTIPNTYKVTDKDVADYIVQIRFQNRVAENGTTQVQDKALKLGDDAFIYYKGFLDGKEFDGGSNWDDESPYQLGLGSGSFIPGFEEALVGMIPNATSKEKPAEIKVTFPETYQSEELKGKETTFQIYVVYAIQYAMPEYNKEFVLEDLEYETQVDFYASDKALLKEFEGLVRENLESKMAENIEGAKVEALWEHLVAEITCKNLPKTELDYYFNAYESEMKSEYEYGSAYYGDEFKKVYPTVDDFAIAYFYFEKGTDWRAEIRAMAEKMVKKDMITHAIGEIEGIETVTDEEYEAQIKYWVDAYYGYMTEAEIVQSMGEVFLRESAFAEKMQDWLFSKVQFTYEDGSAIPEIKN